MLTNCTKKTRSKGYQFIIKFWSRFYPSSQKLFIEWLSCCGLEWRVKVNREWSERASEWRGESWVKVSAGWAVWIPSSAHVARKLSRETTFAPLSLHYFLWADSIQVSTVFHSRNKHVANDNLSMFQAREGRIVTKNPKNLWLENWSASTGSLDQLFRNQESYTYQKNLSIHDFEFFCVMVICIIWK